MIIWNKVTPLSKQLRKLIWEDWNCRPAWVTQSPCPKQPKMKQPQQKSSITKGLVFLLIPLQVSCLKVKARCGKVQMYQCIKKWKQSTGSKPGPWGRANQTPDGARRRTVVCQAKENSILLLSAILLAWCTCSTSPSIPAVPCLSHTSP